MSNGANPLTPDEAIAIARKIGERMVASAFWNTDRDRCNWLGRTDRRPESRPGLISAATALEVNFYSGSTGVAFFLTELYRFTGEDRFREAALGALLRSVDVFLDQPLERAVPLSFYLGHLGAIYVIHRFQEVAGDLVATDRLGELMDAVEQSVEHDDEAPLDVMGGHAGTIPVCLHLANMVVDPASAERFRRWGQKLAQRLAGTAHIRDGRALWSAAQVGGPESKHAETEPCPTGFSHGASGLAWGLFEAAEAFGTDTYRKLAQAAVRYEDDLFNAEAGNWHFARPDMRQSGFSFAWCHGAPGISFVRARAAILDADQRDDHRTKARIALKTTQQSAERFLNGQVADSTFCHGASGLCEILLIVGQMLEDRDALDTAKVLAASLAERFEPAGNWPSGMPSHGQSPALFLGNTGLGCLYLRLAGATNLPSPLFPTMAPIRSDVFG